MSSNYSNFVKNSCTLPFGESILYIIQYYSLEKSCKQPLHDPSPQNIDKLCIETANHRFILVSVESFNISRFMNELNPNIK